MTEGLISSTDAMRNHPGQHNNQENSAHLNCQLNLRTALYSVINNTKGTLWDFTRRES